MLGFAPFGWFIINEAITKNFQIGHIKADTMVAHEEKTVRIATITSIIITIFGVGNIIAEHITNVLGFWAIRIFCFKQILNYFFNVGAIFRSVGKFTSTFSAVGKIAEGSAAIIAIKTTLSIVVFVLTNVISNRLFVRATSVAFIGPFKIMQPTNARETVKINFGFTTITKIKATLSMIDKILANIISDILKIGWWTF